MSDPIEVVIPTRNAPAALWLTLTHLLAYGARGVAGITLLDNRSEAPGTEQVLAFARFAGCRVVRHERNVGVWASVNRGLAETRSRWVLVLTADVLLGHRTPEYLRVAAEQQDAPFIGPEVVTGIEGAPSLALCADVRNGVVDCSTYNGAAWLMDWPRLREAVGWFDPRFYVAAGDTDYAERVRDAGLQYAVLRGVPCVHLDKQSRRQDSSAAGDTRIEIEDLGRFRDKWAGRPDVLARHGMPDLDQWVANKGGEDGWKAGLVG